MCGAVRGTATAALQVDAGEPPLQIRRLQQQIQYDVKVVDRYVYVQSRQ